MMPIPEKQLKDTADRAAVIGRRRSQAGFSLIEMMIALTITLIVISLAFTLLAQALNRKVRNDKDADAMGDANQALAWMSREITNAGFGLDSNGLVAADCTENQIRIRSNLNAMRKETTSGTVADQDEDVEYYLISNPNINSVLVRTDVGRAQTTVIATEIDNIDVNGNSEGDGLNFDYLDASNNPVAPASAERVRITIRIIIPQTGMPGSQGYQPSSVKVVTQTVALRNTLRMGY